MVAMGVADMAFTDDPGNRVSEIAAQTVMMFVQESLPQIVRAIEVRIKAEFGGEQVHFRKDRADRVRVRNEMIAHDLASGMSMRAVAKKWNLSCGQISKIARRMGCVSICNVDGNAAQVSIESRNGAERS